MTFKVFRAKYSDYKDKIKTMIHRHYNEARIPGAEELALNINEKFYEELERFKLHLGVGIATEEDEIIGYISIIINHHHQHTQALFAMTDGFYIDPKYRGLKSYKALCQAFSLAESILKEDFGVDYFYLGCNAQNDLPFLAKKLNMTKAAIMYIKRL